jgi:hypothetical protein
VGGWYGLRNGYRGRFGMYLPPLLEALGLAELTHEPRNNRMRAIYQEGTDDAGSEGNQVHNQTRVGAGERAADP